MANEKAKNLSDLPKDDEEDFWFKAGNVHDDDTFDSARLTSFENSNENSTSSELKDMDRRSLDEIFNNREPSNSKSRDKYLPNIVCETVRAKTSVVIEKRFTSDIEKSFTLSQSEDESYHQTRNKYLEPSPAVLEVLCRISSPATRQRFYVKDESFHRQFPKNRGDTVWRVLSSLTDLRELKTQSVQEYVCASLNSRYRLIMYYGINKDLKIEGVILDVDARDQFRVGLDFALSRAFRPILQPNMYNVEFIPVFGIIEEPAKTERKETCAIKDCFIVEIQIRLIATEVYQLEENGKVYVKLDERDKPTELSINDARRFFAKQLEKGEEKKIDALKRDIELFKISFEYRST